LGIRFPETDRSGRDAVSPVAPTRTAIVGGGMLGLSLALRLLQRGEKVTLFEAAGELGGLAAPFTIGDVTWDRYYHIIVPRDRRLLQLLDELGLGPEVAWTTPKTGFYTSGGFHSMSNALEFLSFKPLGLFDKLRLGAAIVYAGRFIDPVAMEDVTAEAWLTKICGRRTFEKIWRPLLRAKFGDSYGQVSAAFICATIVRYYGARQGGVGRDECGYVAGGYHRILGTLVGKIEAMGVDAVLGARIKAIRRGDPGPTIEFEDGSTRAFDRVITTIAAPIAARLCVDLTDVERQRLNSKRYIGIVCVSLLLRSPLGPYYVTNLTDEWVPFSAVIDMAAVVDRKHFGGNALVYLPKYVAPDDPLFARTDESIVDEFVAALTKMYPDFSPDSVIAARVSRAPAVFAMTTLGYSKSLPAIATSVPGLYTVNSAQLINTTLVVDETLGLADRALEALAADDAAAPVAP
jgi:protoporphyrinogen oxidase